MPPNILRFLDDGLAEPGRWRVPLVLRLDSRVSADDVRAVLTAVVNHHDALRMRRGQPGRDVGTADRRTR